MVYGRACKKNSKSYCFIKKISNGIVATELQVERLREIKENLYNFWCWRFEVNSAVLVGGIVSICQNEEKTKFDE
jgi:NADH:ubiquinone oxidoreductase subunit 6 (subunit J)